MSAYFKLHSLRIHVDDSSAVVIPDLLNVQSPLNPQIRKEITAADVSPTFLAHFDQRPVTSLASFAIPSILTAIGMRGVCIKTGTNPGVHLFIAQHNECGDLVDGSVHRSYGVLAGMVVPRTLTVEHQGDARLNFDVVVVRKDGNAAIVLAETAALPTISIAASRWTLGKTTVGNVELGKYTSLTIDFGVTVEQRGVESEVWPSSIEVKTSEPTITIRGVDPKWFIASGGVPIGGLACTHANTKIYLRKRLPDVADFVADETEQHVSFTAAGVAVVTEAAQGDARRHLETEVVVHGKIDGSGNAPLIYDGATAIT